MYPEASGDQHQLELEQRVLSRWKSENVFQRAQARRANAPRFTFYEGPPTANGRPGIHHVLARTLKDVACRYQDLAGHLVERKGGWDTHGLPVEVEVEKRLGIHGKEAIRAYGLEAFTKACLDSVFTYVSDWEKITERIGYWLDTKNAYVTYHESFVESVWWSLSELYKKGLLYQSHKVVWWWPQGGTALSAGEVGLGYRETQDPSVLVRFRVRNSSVSAKPTFFLAWTTTPWTLPSNVALAVGPKVRYGAYDLGEEVLIVAEALASAVLKDRPSTPVGSFEGSELVGKSYEPLYAFEVPEGGRAYEVIAGDFVATDTGTGVVHLAPAFGEDDYRVCRAAGLGFLQLVDPDGRMSQKAGAFAGKMFKEADKDITRDLKERGLLFSQSTLQHEYPFCWRAANDPLIQYARHSWFVRTTAFKDQLLANNQSVSWFPGHIQEGRFGDFLRNNVDWALSRERFFGTPLPIWINDVTGALDCVGSVAEILARNPQAFAAFDRAQAADPSLSIHLRVHKPWIDDVTWTKPGEPGVYRRVPEVIDCWYDSGAMPFAQRHYPFENRELFEKSHPADFICEGLDQTRGWFYSLLAISTLLFGKSPYRRVMVNGLVLDKQGRKMSKSLGNTVNPWTVIDEHGSDPLRWYLLANSPPWAAKAFDVDGVAEAARKVFGTLWPSYNFFALYANIEKWTPAQLVAPRQNVMDRWILSRTHSLVRDFRAAMDAYDPQKATRILGAFIVDELSNWYIRRSRPRFWKSKDKADQAAAFGSLWFALDTVAVLLAPIAPLTADELDRNLHSHHRKHDSVHLRDLPVADESKIDPVLERKMAAIIEVVSLGRAARESAKLRIRQPLSRLVASGPDAIALGGLYEDELAREVKDELNVKELVVAERSGQYCTVTIKPNLPVVGKKHGKHLDAIRNRLKNLSEADVAAFEESGELAIEIPGQAIRLQGDDLLVQRSGREGFAVAAHAGYLAALDTALTPELVQEGLARELINRIQNQRKSQGFAVTDRITIGIAGPAEILAAFAAHESRIVAEVMAVRSTASARPGDLQGSAVPHEVEGHPVHIVLERAEWAAP